jgi:trehalose-6-phosphatase
MESVQLVFDYFCERTPRSFVESRETSIVWNYKYADAEFGRLQARDLLQHLWTGPISNAPVDIVQVRSMHTLLGGRGTALLCCVIAPWGALGDVL